MGDNALAGNIPTEIGNLSTLWEFRVNGNFRDERHAARFAHGSDQAELVLHAGHQPVRAHRFGFPDLVTH